MAYAMKKTLLIKINGVCFFCFSAKYSTKKNHRSRTNAVDILTVELISVMSTTCRQSTNKNIKVYHENELKSSIVSCIFFSFSTLNFLKKYFQLKFISILIALHLYLFTYWPLFTFAFATSFVANRLLKIYVAQFYVR